MEKFIDIMETKGQLLCKTDYTRMKLYIHHHTMVIYSVIIS